MATNRFLIRPEEGAWIVEHNGRAIGSYPEREAALAQARRRARLETGEVLIVGPDGRVADEERYGTPGARDPVG